MESYNPEWESYNHTAYNQYVNKGAEYQLDEHQVGIIPTTIGHSTSPQHQIPEFNNNNDSHGVKRKRRKKRKSSRSLEQTKSASTCTGDLYLLNAEQTQTYSQAAGIMSVKSDANNIEKIASDMNGQMKLNGIQNIIRVMPVKTAAVSATMETKLSSISNTRSANDPMTVQANQEQISLNDSNHFLSSTAVVNNLIPPTINEPLPKLADQQRPPKPSPGESPESVIGSTRNNNNNNNVKARKRYSSEVLLKPAALSPPAMESDDTTTDMETSDTQPAQNGEVYTKPPPRRSISMPTKTRTDSTKTSDTDSLSRWRSVKNAVKITTNMAKQNKSRKDSFMEKFNTNRQATHSLLDPMEEMEEVSQQPSWSDDSYLKIQSKKCSRALRNKCTELVFHPDGNFLFFWLLVLSVTVEYNLWIQILRQAFPSVQEELPALWFSLDAFADVIYLLDILVQFRTGFLEDGLLVSKQKHLAKHYIRSKYFYIDVASLIPFDFLYFAFGVQPLLRFPRFIKIYRLVQFLYLAENQATYPNVLRVCNLTHILLLLCHWFAAFYYMISKAEDLAGNWVVGNTNETLLRQTTRQYLKSLYWSTLTLTTIGDLPSPESNWQYLFQILSYLIGVFVFATIVGQVGNSINNNNATRHEYEQLLDGAKLYMRKHEVPKDMQVRVQRWCDYAWNRGKLQGALDINSLKMLPDRLKTELALHVHLDILKQVTIFEECEPEFLHDLVLKMQTYIFTPGDMVVRKGEIAREMFIIADGHLDVIGNKGKMIARLSTGNFFGEIGILNLDGGINRRTADVKSVGYSELFVLKREDVVRAIKYYPSAKASLMKHAKQRLAEMREHASDFISETPMHDPPKIMTEDADDSQYSLAQHLEVPGSSSSDLRSRQSRNSVYSIKSIDINDDTMRVRENELIAKLTEDIEEKDSIINKLNSENNQLRKLLKEAKESVGSSFPTSTDM